MLEMIWRNRGLLYTVGGNKNWYNDYKKPYGDASKR
jgi:hypothetical protein